MSAINTIKVMYKPGKYEMVINEDDFDDKIHEKIGEKPGEYEMVINEDDFDDKIHEKIGEKPAKGKKAEAKNIDEEVKNLIGEE